jgi:hypothetical protein
MREAGFHTELGDKYKGDAGDVWTGCVIEDSRLLCGWSLMEESKVNNAFTTSTWEGLEGHDLNPCLAVMEARGGELFLHIWE